ncbi:hypothetical protein [Sorangium sp. So ce1182]|uniref:hypothetical protein n=1 Tax=Sorangium sp. So ce1182 TaxID=3133334 RepID=UPI003F5DC736
MRSSSSRRRLGAGLRASVLDHTYHGAVVGEIRLRPAQGAADDRYLAPSAREVLRAVLAITRIAGTVVV